MEFNYKQFKYKIFQFLNIVEMLHPNTRLVLSSKVVFVNILNNFATNRGSGIEWLLEKTSYRDQERKW